MSSKSTRTVTKSSSARAEPCAPARWNYAASIGSPPLDFQTQAKTAFRFSPASAQARRPSQPPCSSTATRTFASRCLQVKTAFLPAKPVSYTKTSSPMLASWAAAPLPVQSRRQSQFHHHGLIRPKRMDHQPPNRPLAPVSASLQSN